MSGPGHSAQAELFSGIIRTCTCQLYCGRFYT